MTVRFSAGNSSVSAQARDLVTSALKEVNWIALDDTPSATDAAWGLEKLQRLIDTTNARKEMIYNVNFSEYALIPNHTPHTIGPNGDFSTSQRPIKLINCALVLQGQTPIDIPVYNGDDAWWAQQAIKGLTSTLFTGVYYSPDIPLGNLFFWPVPTQANHVRLETWVNLTQAVSLSSTIGCPPAYWNYLVTTLAVELGPATPTLVEQQKRAEQAITDNNGPSPRMSTAGGGLPTAQSRGRGRPDFDFLTGKPW